MLPALAENASALRHAFDDWARAAKLPDELVETMSLAVYEAMANAVEHAYRGRAAGTLRVHALVAGAPEHVLITVEDEGRWRTPDTDDGLRGRGIPLMEALAGSVDIASRADGTTVTMAWPADGGGEPGR